MSNDDGRLKAGGTPPGQNMIRKFFSLSTLQPLGLTMVLHLAQNWCGVNVIVFKTVESSVDPYTCTFIVGVVQLLATGVSLVLVDKAGRRPLLIISGLVMTITMGSLALYLTFITQVPDYLKWVPLALIIGSFIGFSIGFATIPFCMMGELLPQSTRSLTGAISSSFNLTSLFLALKFYDSLASVIGYDGVYWLYSGVSFLAVVLVYFLLPETKGKSLSEIEEMFG